MLSAQSDRIAKPRVSFEEISRTALDVSLKPLETLGFRRVRTPQIGAETGLRLPPAILQKRGLSNHQFSLTFQGLSAELCRKLRGGGAKGSRTPDLLNAIQALSQLSYGPIFRVQA